ncbi:hypothetical protein VPHK404_0019 [Vibrio phage K404]
MYLIQYFKSHMCILSRVMPYVINKGDKGG